MSKKYLSLLISLFTISPIVASAIFVNEASAVASNPSKAPARIISLSPSATEDLFAIGAGKSVIAVDSLSNYPRSAPISKLDAYSPNVEAIAKYKPDFVVLQSSASKATSVKTAMIKLKIKVFYEVTPTDINGAYSEILQLGKATGHLAQARVVVQNMKARIARAIASGRKSAPISIFHEVDNTFYSATSKTFIGQVYAAFNTVNIADAADTADSYGYPQLTSEYVIQANPAIIFLGDGEPVANVQARAGWNSIAALTSNQIIELPDDIPSRWGPRLADFFDFVSTHLSATK